MYTEIIPGLIKATNEGMRRISRSAEIAGLSDLFSRPTAVGWKVETADELHEVVARATSVGSVHISITCVNDRYIATIVLPNSVAGISILKLMQKRPGSSDLVGLDHIDFLVSHFEDAVTILTRNDSKLPAQLELNDAHKWLSVDCDGLEAKLIDHTVLELESSRLASIQGALEL